MGHGCSEEKDLEFPRCKGMSNTMQMHKNRHSKDTVLSKKMSLYKYYTSSTRTSRGRKFPVYKKNINLQETSKPIEKKIMHCKAAMVMGSRMQHGSAQPTAAGMKCHDECHD